VSEAHRLFQFGNHEDIITNNELKQIYTNNKESFDNLSHMKRILKQLGADEYKYTSIRGLRRVSLKEEVLEEVDWN
jgi:bacterioferritin (cytochrome b1)